MVENHIVEVGENIVFMFPDEAWERVLVLTRRAAADRWQTDATIAPDGTVTPGPAPILTFDVTLDSVRILWAGLSALVDLSTVAEAVLVSAYGADAVICSTMYRLPLPSQDGIAALIRRDEEYLAVLVKAREDATDTNGIVDLQLPDARREVYRNPAALSAHIAELDARLAILRAGRNGQQFVGMAYR